MFDAPLPEGYNGRVMTLETWGFDLLVERTEDGYRASVLNSPAGFAYAIVQAPFTQRELATYRTQLASDPGPSDGDRLDAQLALARQIGERLFRAIFRDTILTAWQESWRKAYARRHHLRLRLCLRDQAEFMALPWEYLYDPERREFLALSAATPLSRYLEQMHQLVPNRVELPLRVLVVLAGPSGYPPLPIELEWRNLIDTLDYLAVETNRRVIFERLAQPTLLNLQRHLRQKQVDVLHFIGFSTWDDQSQEGQLIFEDEMGRGRPVSGQHLGRLLQDHFPLRLALLNARNAARPTPVDPTVHVAQQAVRRGLPAAVAMPATLPARMSLAFAHDFYGALAAFRPVDEAVHEARRAMFTEEAGIAWGTPVLLSRIAEGTLYEPKVQTPPPPRRLNMRSVLDKPTRPRR